MKVLLVLLLIAYSIPYTFSQMTNEQAQHWYQLLNQEEYQKIVDEISSIDIVLDTTFFNILGEAEYYTGQWISSKKHLTAYHQFDSQNTKCLQYLIKIYEQEGNTPKAIKYFKRLLNIKPDHVPTLKKLGEMLWKSGEISMARSILKKAYSINNNDIQLVGIISNFYIAIDSFHQADSILSNALMKNPEHINLLLIAGKIQFHLDDYNECIQYLEMAKKHIDLTSNYRKLLGYAYLQIDSIDRAIYELENIIHSSEAEHIHYYLALAYNAKKDVETALFHFDQAVSKGVSPRLEIYCRHASRTAYHNHQLKTALEYIQLAYDFTKNENLYYDLATLSDEYYKDKTIAMRYYKLFIKHNLKVSKKRKYAQERYRYLSELNHQSNSNKK